MARMEASCEAMKLRLKATLGEVTYVTVTADCWTTFRRSYLAATVSWLEPSLSRKSAVLLCRRMTGRVTYDKIADTLQKSFDDCGLRGKVTKVITDNSANFVKAFRLFGEKDVKDAHHAEDDEAFTEAVEVAPLLDNVAVGEARLPPHHRCSAHTLNLVATADASEAERHEIFSRPLRSVFGTCRALWCKQGQSAIAAETTIKYCGKSLLRPVSTRWNSFFDALDCLTALDCDGKDIDGLCSAQFQRPRDLLFMKEYYEFCRPLVHAIFNGIKKRFDHLHGDRELLLASALIPRFKANWVTDLARREALAEQLTEELSHLCYRSTTAIGAPSAQEDGADHSTSDYFSFAMTTTSTQAARILTKQWPISGDGLLASGQGVANAWPMTDGQWPDKGQSPASL
ncbi:hypothetical protein ISCGN_011173 [Ixodes scapularis]